MARRSDFVEFVAGQLAFVGGLRIRAMFGGYGIYQDDCMFALIADDRLYFKADATTRAEFEAQGLFSAFYVHFLNHWSNPHHPEYDFATRELIYRNDKGNEVKRLPFPPLSERYSESLAPIMLAG